MQCQRHARLGFVSLLSSAALLAVGGCTSLTRPSAPPPPAPLQLLSAGPLELPANCDPADGKVYRTHFVVEIDGRVTDARSDSGEGCVQQALRSWVSSFRYAPLEAARPTAFDWREVTASRGG